MNWNKTWLYLKSRGVFVPCWRSLHKRFKKKKNKEMKKENIGHSYTHIQKKNQKKPNKKNSP
jgi:hypothetical protein